MFFLSAFAWYCVKALIVAALLVVFGVVLFLLD